MKQGSIPEKDKQIIFLKASVPVAMLTQPPSQ
jgi:hypothetical protein